MGGLQFQTMKSAYRKPRVTCGVNVLKLHAYRTLLRIVLAKLPDLEFAHLGHWVLGASFVIFIPAAHTRAASPAWHEPKHIGSFAANFGDPSARSTSEVVRVHRRLRLNLGSRPIS